MSTNRFGIGVVIAGVSVAIDGMPTRSDYGEP